MYYVCNQSYDISCATLYIQCYTGDAYLLKRFAIEPHSGTNNLFLSAAQSWFLRCYMFRLPTVAIIREPQYDTDTSSLSCVGIWQIYIYIYTLALYNSQFIFYYFVNKPTKAQLQLIYKLSRYYMFRHYRIICKELVFITSPSYIRISITALVKIIYGTVNRYVPGKHNSNITYRLYIRPPHR